MKLGDDMITEVELWPGADDLSMTWSKICLQKSDYNIFYHFKSPQCNFILFYLICSELNLFVLVHFSRNGLCIHNLCAEYLRDDN